MRSLTTAAAIMACALDRWLGLGSGIRAALLTIGCLAVALIVGPALARLLRPTIDWVGVADEIEKTNPQFGERLRTVISQLLERQEYRGSPQMLDYLLAQVSQQAQEHRPKFSWKPLLLPWAVALCLILAAGGIWRSASADSGSAWRQASTADSA